MIRAGSQSPTTQGCVWIPVTEVLQFPFGASIVKPASGQLQPFDPPYNLCSAPRAFQNFCRQLSPFRIFLGRYEFALKQMPSAFRTPPGLPCSAKGLCAGQRVPLRRPGRGPRPDTPRQLWGCLFTGGSLSRCVQRGRLVIMCLKVAHRLAGGPADHSVSLAQHNPQNFYTVPAEAPLETLGTPSLS